MKLADKYIPPLSDGDYTIKVTQEVQTMGQDRQHPEGDAAKKDSFVTEQEFHVLSRGFTLLPDEVFSSYPAENARGDFERELPFLVLKAKTLPWLYGDRKVPWIALIVLSDGDEGVNEQDMTIAQLLAGAPAGTFFPQSEMPERYTEKQEDICRVLDVPRELYRDIVPLPDETRYLCHARYTDLSDTEEEVSQMDGYFSVVIGNRLIPPGKAVMHLVSMLGCPERDSHMYDGYDRVRMVSLYHWSAYCEPEYKEDFRSIISRLDAGMLTGGGSHQLAKRGICAKSHYTRAGDAAGSLFHSPLVPYPPKELPQLIRPCYSADSLLIYDKDNGVFDVTYSAAWQLGRMTALAKKMVPKAVISHRTRILKNGLKAKMRAAASDIVPDFKDICIRMSAGTGKEQR